MAADLLALLLAVFGMMFFLALFSWRGTTKGTRMVIGFSVSLVLIVSGFVGCLRQWATASWKLAPARILHVGSHKHGVGMDGYVAPYLSYEYSVDGKTFSGEDDATTGAISLIKYSEGGIISIYYNPAKPSENVIVTGLRLADNPFMVLLLAGFLLPFCSAILTRWQIAWQQGGWEAVLGPKNGSKKTR